MPNNHLKEHFGYWLHRVRTEVGGAFEDRLIKHGVTVPMWNVLVSIYDGKGASVSELTNYIEVDCASISRTVEKLVQRSFLVHKEGKDRRSGLIELTDNGKKLVPVLINEAEKNEKHFFGSLSNEQNEQLKLILRNVISTSIPSVDIDGILTYDKVGEILKQGKDGKRSFPQTFALLKQAGVGFYEVKFIDSYSAIYYGNFGVWNEAPPQEYKSLKLSGAFSEEGIRRAIIDHIQNQTHFVEFLADIARYDCSHYTVCMEQNVVRYYSNDGKQYQEEKIPEWKDVY